MKILSIASFNFKGKIIDAHTHTGTWDKPKGGAYTIGDIFEVTNSTKKNGDTVEKIVVSNLDCLSKDENGKFLSDEIYSNLHLLDDPDFNENVIPLAVCEPKTGDVKNIEKLFKTKGDRFFGLKIHPDASNIMADSKLITPYLEFARKENLPVVFHSGINYKPKSPDFVEKKYRYSDPRKVYKAAKRTPEVPVVMAHLGAGGSKVHKFAIEALVESIEKGDATLYADISWVDIHTKGSEMPNLIKTIKLLKNTSKGDMTERLLFGSDAPIAEFARNENEYPDFVEKIKTAIKNDPELAPDADELIDKIFYKNSEKLFLERKEKSKGLNTVV